MPNVRFSISERLLSHGFFPKELPPPFTTCPFAQWASSNNSYIEDLSTIYITRLVRHKLARPGTNRRLLSIPNPINQLRLSLVVEKYYDELKKALGDVKISSSRPEITVSGHRAIRPKYVDSLSHYRTKIRTGNRFLVRSDISRFYPSIYTHSLPWAIHGKDNAKRNKTVSLFGNLIDQIVRNSQFNQTIGLPIGPDTSFLLSEVLAHKIDDRLQPMRGFRWFDDYEAAFFDRSEAERWLVRLEQALSEYELEINSEKTEILALPQPLENGWVSLLRGIEFKNPAHQREQLQTMFSLAFELTRQHAKDGILKFAVKKLYETDTRGSSDHLMVHEHNWELAYHLILQVAMAEPDTLPTVLGLIAFYATNGFKVDTQLLSETLASIVKLSVDNGFASEAAWAIWGYIEHRIEISDEVVREALLIDDDVLACLLLDARDKGLAAPNLDWSPIENLVASSDFESEHWLLAYEAAKKGWLSEPHTDLILTSPHCKALIKGGVYFYRGETQSYASAKHSFFGAPSWLLGVPDYF